MSVDTLVSVNVTVAVASVNLAAGSLKPFLKTLIVLTNGVFPRVMVEVDAPVLYSPNLSLPDAVC